jgi:hypothetical protein
MAMKTDDLRRETVKSSTRPWRPPAIVHFMPFEQFCSDKNPSGAVGEEKGQEK